MPQTTEDELQTVYDQIDSDAGGEKRQTNRYLARMVESMVAKGMDKSEAYAIAIGRLKELGYMDGGRELTLRGNVREQFPSGRPGQTQYKRYLQDRKQMGDADYQDVE